MDRTPACRAGGQGLIPRMRRIFILNWTFSQRKCGQVGLYTKLEAFNDNFVVYELWDTDHRKHVLQDYFTLISICKSKMSCLLAFYESINRKQPIFYRSWNYDETSANPMQCYISSVHTTICLAICKRYIWSSIVQDARSTNSQSCILKLGH